MGYTKDQLIGRSVKNIDTGSTYFLSDNGTDDSILVSWTAESSCNKTTDSHTYPIERINLFLDVGNWKLIDEPPSVIFP